MIYLDNAATTKIDPRVLDVMMPYLSDEYGNAGTLYGLGRRAREAVDMAREQVAKFMHCEPDQIIFTSGGTEGNNLVICGLADHLKSIDKKHIITSTVEHDSVIHAVDFLCTKDGFDAEFLPVSRGGSVDVESLNVTANTGLVSVMYENNETGVDNPVWEIATKCQENGVLFHSDCVQAAGLRDVYMDEIPCDFATISSHKIHGPKGAGAVFARDKELLRPIINGGADQEFGLRGGTENVAAIVGFGMACEIAGAELYQNAMQVSNMRAAFLDALHSKMCDYSGWPDKIYLNGVRSQVLGKTISLLINGVDAETLLLMLDAKGICVSAGSACRSHVEDPSHVLTAMGLTEDEARSSVRVSFSATNSFADVIYAAETMAACINTLRNCT